MYDKILIHGYPCLIGEDIPFEKKECFTLKPGDTIMQIGKYTSGCSRETRFTYPAKYVGRINIDEKDFAAFWVDDREIEGFDASYPRRPVYVLYVVLEEQGELLHISYRNLTPGIHKAVFQKYK